MDSNFFFIHDTLFDFRLCEYQEILQKYRDAQKEADDNPEIVTEDGAQKEDNAYETAEDGTLANEVDDQMDANQVQCNENDTGVEDDFDVNQLNYNEDDTHIDNMFEPHELPHPKEVTPKQLQDIMAQYDLPPFPELKTMGHSPVFTQQQELEMLSYLKDCHCLGIPCTWKDFQADIQLFYDNQHKDDKEKKNYVFGIKIK